MLGRGDELLLAVLGAPVTFSLAARERESGVTLAQISKDFGIHEMTLQKWLRRADIDEGRKPGTTSMRRTTIGTYHVAAVKAG